VRDTMDRGFMLERIAMSKLDRKNKSAPFFVLFFVSMVSGCGKKNHWEACPPLPVIDGYVTTKTQQGGLTLKLPDYVDVRRDSRPDRGCQYVQQFYVDYLWYEGKLLPEAEYRFKVPQDNRIKLRIYFDGGAFAKVGDMYKDDKQPWNFEPALPHKLYPLEFYPRYYWDDPVHPSPGALKRAALDHIWGVRDTKYKKVTDARPFTAACSIPSVDESRPDSRIEAEFAVFGDSKCRGGVSASKNGKTLSVMIDVWRAGAPQINNIYDAVAEQLQSFIQE